MIKHTFNTPTNRGVWLKNLIQTHLCVQVCATPCTRACSQISILYRHSPDALLARTICHIPQHPMMIMVFDISEEAFDFYGFPQFYNYFQ